MKYSPVFRLLGVICVLGSSAVPRALAQATSATFGQIVSLGGTPSDIVLDELRGRLYLVNSAANRVDILSTADQKKIGAIGVGITPLSAAISLDGAYLYVTNNKSSSVSVVDLSNNSVVQTVTLPAAPEGVEVGADGRALITTAGTGTGNPPQNSLIVFDRTQNAGQQLIPVQAPPPPTTPQGLPLQILTRPALSFRSKLIRTPDGNFIIGLTNPSTTQTYLFVYEVASGVILRSRTVTGQSTVLSVSPDGARFMAGFTLYDTASLSVIAQQSNANAPFSFTANFNAAQNVGGSVFSPDGTTLYSAFNVAPNTPNTKPNASTLLISDPQNLAIKLGIKIPESILNRMVMTSDGASAWSLSQSGLIYLPLSTLYDYPIIQPETTAVFLASDPCNRGVTTASLRVLNLGKGRLSFNFATPPSALVAEISSGLAPATVKLTLEPGRANVTRKPGTNLSIGSTVMTGAPLDLTLTSFEAINIPNTIRVYMNSRDPDQRGLVFPIPQGPNNSVAAQGTRVLAGGNEGVQDIVLDEPRGRVYITNSAYNRIEVFDIVNQKFIDPIVVGQLPHQMAMGTDGNTLFVGNTGGESIAIVDLTVGKVVDQVQFPPYPRQAGGNTAALVFPRTLAMGAFGLQFIMSNGTQWKLVGNQATVRLGNSITPQTIPAPQAMIASPDANFIFTLGATGIGYLYDATIDAYTNSQQIFTAPLTGYYGPLAAAPGGSYFLANALTLNPALSTLLPTTQRNVAAVAALDQNTLLRLTTVVRQNINTVPRDDERPSIDMVNVQTGDESLLGVLAEQPRVTVFSNQAATFVTPRQIVVDSTGTAYILTISGLTVVPLTIGGASKPQIATGLRAIVNSNDGTPNISPGSFISVSGSNLAGAGTAQSIPPPTVLGGSCITFNDIALPLLQTSSGQILAQIPGNVLPGTNVVQVKSLATGQTSDPVMVNVQKPQ